MAIWYFHLDMNSYSIKVRSKDIAIWYYHLNIYSYNIASATETTKVQDTNKWKIKKEYESILTNIKI